jgi:hypothetical protein
MGRIGPVEREIRRIGSINDIRDDVCRLETTPRRRSKIEKVSAMDLFENHQKIRISHIKQCGEESTIRDIVELEICRHGSVSESSVRINKTFNT